MEYYVGKLSDLFHLDMLESAVVELRPQSEYT